MRDQKGYHDLRLPVGLVYVSLGLKKTEDNPNSNFKASSCDHFQVLSAYHALSYTKSFISLTSYIQPHTIFFYYPLRSHSSNHSSVGRTVHSLEPPGASPPEPRRRRSPEVRRAHPAAPGLAPQPQGPALWRPLAALPGAELAAHECCGSALRGFLPRRSHRAASSPRSTLTPTKFHSNDYCAVPAVLFLRVNFWISRFLWQK